MFHTDTLSVDYFQFLVPCLGVIGIGTFIFSFRYHPGTSTKDALFTLFPLFVEVSQRVGWIKTLGLLISISFGIIGLALLAWVSMVAYFQRKLIFQSQENPEIEKTLLGRPLLFPSRLTHSRMFPEKYTYWINYFLVGIPVGLRGRVGAVLSIDSDESQQNSSDIISRVFKMLLWFRVDTNLYLHGGDGHLGLAKKLEIFLKEQGEDPSQFPYAYIVGIPRFLWWTKSPISYWYLYSPSKELCGIIMEINNSYGEKKNAFTRLYPEESSVFEKAKKSETISVVSGRGPEGTQSTRFISSAPGAKYYKGSWDKDIFASPFEKVEGWFSLRFVDPLDPSPAKGGPLHSNMTLMSTAGKPKISSRLYSCAPPLDPLLASSWEVVIFLLNWSFTVPLSIGRIVVEALRIRFRGNLPYLNKPDVKPNNIPRKASKTEKTLEPFFRLYLSRLIDACPFPLTVIYIPAKSMQITPITMHSPIKTLTSAPRPTLTIQPLTPKFYTNILKYNCAVSAFMAEMQSEPQICDPISQRLWASDHELFQSLIKSAQPPPVSKISRSVSVLPWQRSTGRTFMDEFSEKNFPVGMYRRYRAAWIHCCLTERFAWGSYNAAAVHAFFLRLAFMWVIFRALVWNMYGSSALGLEHVVMASGIEFLGVRWWAILSDWFFW
ncbi:hypothetical protein N7490_008286 [Penicillium lividum]|nr:hypothetical protein N7490_008286 [Penicillium lividum]